MNNEQFRNLLLANSAKPASKSNGPSSTPNQASSGTLGSRQRANIPMTPRSVAGGGADFARQLAQRNQASQPQKKFRSSAPKGARFAEGYVDRAKARESEEEDDRAKRIKALEEALKKEEIDQATFDKLRYEIAGGDLSSTHLVKGLDFKLLERVRKGEDVYDNSKQEAEQEDEAAEPAEDDEDADGAFDEMQERNVEAISKEKTEKKGQLAPAALIPGKKRTRDQVIAELKAAREAAKANTLGDRFKKVGVKQKPGTRIERDSKGREVLIIVDEDGHEKRKVRKIQPEAEEAKQRELMIPDKNAKPLGMEVPEIYQKKQESESEDDDIFGGVGDDYDPLAGMDSSSDEDESGDEKGEVAEDGSRPAAEAKESTSPNVKGAMAPPPKPLQPHNYFKDSKTELISSQSLKAPSMSDPAIMAAFKRAAQLNPIAKEEDEVDEETKARDERRKRMLQQSDRDDQDMDMGFGTSRFEDEEDFEEKKIKLSQWGQDDDEDDGKGGKTKRKRGPKKKKGDVNSAADVLRVMEQRKAAKS